MNDHSAILETLMINHKNATFQLMGYDLDSQKLLTDLLREHQNLFYYLMQVSISQALALDNIVTITLSKFILKFEDNIFKDTR